MLERLALFLVRDDPASARRDRCQNGRQCCLYFHRQLKKPIAAAAGPLVRS
jgi:hypothetical protein